MLDHGTLLALLGFSSLQFAGGIWTGIRLRPTQSGTAPGWPKVDTQAADLLAAVEAQSASLFALRHQAKAITAAGEQHLPPLNVNLLGELRLLQQSIGEIANSLKSSVSAYQGKRSTKQLLIETSGGSSFRLDRDCPDRSDKAVAAQSSRSIEGAPLTTEPQRGAYKVKQRFAEYDGYQFPQSEQFMEVLCHELWMEGISFVTAKPPITEKVVVTLGSPESPMYMAARVSDCASAVVRGQLTDRYVVSCTFIGRLAPPRNGESSDHLATREFAHASLSRR